MLDSKRYWFQIWLSLELSGFYHLVIQWYFSLLFNSFFQLEKLRVLRSANIVPKSKFWFLAGFIIFLHCILAYRFFQLQVLDHDEYSRRAENNRIRVTSIPAPRGLILDRHGEIIVDNYPTYILSAIGSEIVNKEKNYEVISTAIGIDTATLKKNYKNYYRNQFLPTRLAKDLTIEQLSRLEEAKDEVTGIIYSQFPERIFNPKIRASHVLGYLKEIDQGMIKGMGYQSNYQHGDLMGWSGLERQYEHRLRGEKGVAYYQVDAFGREAGYVDGHEKILPNPGNNIHTTLDVSLQALLESEFKKKKGTAIVSNPKTGGILAYVSAPDYKPDLFTGMISNKDWQTVIADPNRPLLNRVTNGTYPPGSIYKMVVGVELLEKRLVTMDWSVFCSGDYEFYDRTFRCWNEYGHGKINLEQAIVQSCDVYFYQAIQNVDIDDLAYRSKQLLYGIQTAIDLPTEMKGRVPNRQFMNKLYGRYGWSKGAMLNLSIGQGELLVTPLQMVAYVNLLATRGKTYPLHLVHKQETMIEAPSIRNETWRLIKDYMELTITQSKGTGRRSNPKIPGLIIGGKTGTAENPHGEPHAWFIAYGEKDGEMITITIMIENGGHGGEVAAPVAKKVFQHYFGPIITKLADKQ